MAERKPTTVRGYIPKEMLELDVGPDFVLRRRGPRRPTIEEGHREEMMAYAEGQGIMATYPEATVHYELTERRYVDGIHYSFQSSLFGGRLQLGGSVVDFLWLERPWAWRVMGEFWHQPWLRLGQGVGDEEQRLALIGYGYEVTDLWESEILDPDWLEDFLRRTVDQPIVRGMAQWPQ